MLDQLRDTTADEVALLEPRSVVWTHLGGGFEALLEHDSLLFEARVFAPQLLDLRDGFLHALGELVDRGNAHAESPVRQPNRCSN